MTGDESAISGSDSIRADGGETRDVSVSGTDRIPDEANCPNCRQPTDKKRKDAEGPSIHFTQFICWNMDCSVDIFSVPHAGGEQP